jgi:hypothetical protein
MLYTTVLFVHILAALAYVAALGIVYACVMGLRRARNAEVLRLWTTTATHVTRTVVPISGVLVILAGLYMLAVAWRGNGTWALVALGAFFLVGLVTGAFQGRWIAMLGASVAPLPDDALLSDELRIAARDPRLLFTANGSLAIVGGVLYLMVAKPDLIFSLVVIGCAALVGLAAGALFNRPARTVAARQRANMPA